MQQPHDQPHHEHHRDGEDQAENGGQDQKESPIATRVPPRLAQVAGQQAIVAPVGLPSDVKGVAQDRN